MSKFGVIAERTFDPKVSHYLADGSGRDSYVITNNGGLTAGRLWNQKDSKTFFMTSQKYFKRESPSPRKEAMPFEYRSDGSGRDSYILHNSGGLKNKMSGLTSDKLFKSTLR